MAVGVADPGLQNTQQNIRIPLVNVGDSRLSGGGTGSFYDQVFVNSFPLVARHPVTGETNFSVTKRPGIGVLPINFKSILGAVPVTPMANIGITQLSDVCVAALYVNSTTSISIIQYRPYAGTMTLLGTITGATLYDKVYFTEMMVTTSEVPGLAVTWCKGDYISSQGLFCQSVGGVFTGGSLTRISDANFPPYLTIPDVLVGPMQQLNGYYYVMARSGRIYQSNNAYNITAWGSRIVETYSYPDKAVGIFRFKHHLVAFSDTTVEFFNDSGGRGDGSTITPNLERTEQAFIKFGAIHAKYVKNIDDILYWASSSDTTTTGIWKMDGYTPIKISTYKEDQLLNSGLSLTSDNSLVSGSLESMSILGQKHILLNAVPLTIVPFVNALGKGQYPATDDAYYNILGNDVRPKIMAFCLDTKVWWHLSDCSDINGGAYSYIPCSYFNRAVSDDYSLQYVLKVAADSGSAVPNNHVTSNFIGTYDANNLKFVDYQTSGIYSPKNAVTTIIQTDTFDQNTIQLKYLRKASLVMDTPQQGEQDGAGYEPYIYLSVERNDSQGMFVPENQVVYPIKQRYLANYAPALDINTYSFQALSSLASIANKMTVEGYFLADQTDFGSDNTYAVPIFSWKSDNTSSSWFMRVGRQDPNWYVQFYVANSAAEAPGPHVATYYGPKSGAFWDNWTHFAWVFDLSQPVGSKIQFFLDGVLTPVGGASNIISSSFVTSSDGLTLGSRQTGSPLSSALGVNMSNVRVWNTNRSLQSIKYYANDQTLVSGVTPNLVFNLLDGTNTTLYTAQTPANQTVTFTRRTSPIPARSMFTQTYANNCGLVSRTAFCILHKAPMSFRAQALELNLAQGTR